MTYIFRLIINALVLMLLPYFISGIEIANFYTALITALILSLLNLIIKPILVLLTLPINFLTLGLFTLVINAFLFWFASTFIKGFVIDNFMTAFWAALIFSIFSFFINLIFDRK